MTADDETTESDHGDGDHARHHQHDHGRARGSAAAGIENWRRSELPLGPKLRLWAGNMLTKVRNRSTCCGHPGEPGC